MKILKKLHDLIRQNEQIVKKPQKHDANLQKNSTLFFQIGLIVCLITVYGLFEMEFVKSETFVIPIEDVNEDNFVHVPTEIKVFDDSAPIPKVKRKKTVFKKPIITENSDPAPETPEIFNEPIGNDNPELVPDDINVYTPDEIVDIPVALVEQVPIYPGCEKSSNNDERRKCMSEKISKLIRKKFNTDLAPQFGLSGKQKIDVQFKIDKTGNIVDIKTRAPHNRLGKEAERVINKIPEMIPGKQSNKNVGVIYTIPIIFQVQD